MKCVSLWHFTLVLQKKCNSQGKYYNLPLHQELRRILEGCLLKAWENVQWSTRQFFLLAIWTLWYYGNKFPCPYSGKFQIYGSIRSATSCSIWPILLWIFINYKLCSITYFILMEKKLHLVSDKAVFSNVLNNLSWKPLHCVMIPNANFAASISQK